MKYTVPLHISFFVYQYAKLRMLQFYYDFVDRYVLLFQYCEMETDSACIALAGESIDELVRADRRAHYFRHRSQWLPAECCDEHEDDYVRARIAGRSWTATESCCFARKAFDKRTPGRVILFCTSIVDISIPLIRPSACISQSGHHWLVAAVLDVMTTPR